MLFYEVPVTLTGNVCFLGFLPLVPPGAIYHISSAPDDLYHPRTNILPPNYR
jgi:hypothetical protein